jgi:ribosomal protein L27
MWRENLNEIKYLGMKLKKNQLKKIKKIIIKKIGTEFDIKIQWK